MSSRKKSGPKTFWGDFKTFFYRGLGILLPSVLTLALLWWAYGFLKERVAEPINSAVRQVFIVGAPSVIGEASMPEWYHVSDAQLADTHADRRRIGQPLLTDSTLRARLRADAFRDWWQSRWYMQAMGFIVALIVVYLAGVLVGNLIGRSAFNYVERLLTRLPFLKQVYPSVKQVVEFLLGGGGRALPSNRVVIVEYPRKGIWSLGLMTGETMRVIEAVAGVECVTVFIPSSPTPFTGYTLTVPRDSVIELPISLDEALRFVVSGGVLVPPSQTIGREDAPLRQVAIPEGLIPVEPGDLAAGPPDKKMSAE